MAKSAGRALVDGERAKAYPKLVKALKESMDDVLSELNAAADDDHPTLKAKRQQYEKHLALLRELGEANGE